MSERDEDAWEQFEAEHTEVVGYDLNGFFLPIRPGSARDQALHEQVAGKLGYLPGTPVIKWKQEKR